MKKILLIFCLLLTSCSAQKKLSKLQAHHPELFIEKEITDSFYLPEVKIDTSFPKKSGIDTLKLSKGKLKLNYFEHRDTVYLKAICKDTLLTRKFFINYPKINKDENINLLWIIIFLLGWTLLMLIMLKFK